MAPDWQVYLHELIETGRVGLGWVDNKKFLFAAEKAKSFSAIYPSVVLQTTLKEIELSQPLREEAMLNLLRGWMQHVGPTTNHDLREKLSLSSMDVQQVLLRLESTGLILRGNFTGLTDELEWCERRLLARIHHLTVGRLRKEIEPVTPVQFVQWLLAWQHVLPGTQLRGEHGLIEVLRQLQGFEVPANAWETQILMKRCYLIFNSPHATCNILFFCKRERGYRTVFIKRD